MTDSDDLERDYTLSRKAGWFKLAQTPPRVKPTMYGRAELETMSGPERRRYDSARAVWHANLGPIITTQIEALYDELDEGRTAGGAALAQTARRWTTMTLDPFDLVDQLVDLLVVATHVGLDLRALTGDRSNATSLLAEPLAEAHRILADTAGQRLRGLAHTPGRPIPRSWNQASPSLDTALLGHRDDRLSPTYRLRYRSMTAIGRLPEGIDPTARLRTMPLALWPDWAIRLRPAAIDVTHFRIAAAAALCLPGATCSLGDITRHWQQKPVVDLPRLGRIITDDHHGTAILRAFCALAATLDRNGAPIDYDRRRAIARDIELLDPDTWASICGAGGMLRGAEFKIVAARLWLWETVTGGLVEQAPAVLPRLADSTEFARYRQFAIRLPSQTAHALLKHARELLDANGCRDEPLTWSPPAVGIAVDDLPGLDPDALNPQAPHALLARQIAPEDVAEQLGITSSTCATSSANTRATARSARPA